MKLKAWEIVFVVITVCAVTAAVLCVVIPRTRIYSEPKVSAADSPCDEQYDISAINSATAEDFMKIRGIGGVKAGAIVEYRTAIGGFKHLSQLKDIDGISDAILQSIIKYFYAADSAPAVTLPSDELQGTAAATTSIVAETTSESAQTTADTTAETIITTTAERVMREVDINSAGSEEIADALMIDIAIAEEIVALRERIHYFSSVQELYFCDGMNDKIYQKIKNYIKIGE